jgi:hypothetical protein
MYTIIEKRKEKPTNKRKSSQKTGGHASCSKPKNMYIK